MWGYVRFVSICFEYQLFIIFTSTALEMLVTNYLHLQSWKDKLSLLFQNRGNTLYEVYTFAEHFLFSSAVILKCALVVNLKNWGRVSCKSEELGKFAFGVNQVWTRFNSDKITNFRTKEDLEDCYTLAPWSRIF